MTYRAARQLVAILAFTISFTLGVAASGPRTSASAMTTGQSKAHHNAARIAFSRQLDGGGSNGFTVDPRGNHEQRIAIPLAGEDFGRTVWSHDGNRILFSNIPRIDPNGTLIGFRPGISTPDGTRFHLLALPERPIDMYCSAWTPDDRRIVCGDEVGLFSMLASDGRGVIRLTRNPFQSQDLAIGYSPNGRLLAFIRTNQGDPSDDSDDTAALFVARADGTQVRQVTPFGLLLAHELAGGDWSPDGRHLATATADGRLVIISVHSKRMSTVPLRVDGDYFAVLPTYSPNGKELAFSLFRGAPADIYRARIDGSGVRLVTGTSSDELFADWRSPDR